MARAELDENGGSRTEMEALHKDYAPKGKISLGRGGAGGGRTGGGGFLGTFFRKLTAYVNLLCYVYPTLCALLMFFVVALTLFGVGELIFNPRVKFGYVVDHSNLKSIYDYEIGNVDHWCLRGDSESCTCEDPLQPISRAEHASWKVAFKNNRKIIKALEAEGTSIDVAFIGESVVEEMDGRWMGRQRGGHLQQLKELFDSHFSKAKGGKLNGVALGIAGDTAPNVLFRLMHGEVAEKLHPKVYWLSVGMNDLSRMQCSEEVTVLGILRVVEELLLRTDSHVVINSVLPMYQFRGPSYPILSDALDGFQPTKAGMRGRSRTTDETLMAPRVVVPRSGQGRFLQQQQPPHKINHVLSDKELEEVAEMEEVARNRLYQNKRHDRMPNRDKTLLERHHVRKHAAQRQIPLWTSILVVNRQLQKYAAQHSQRVSFFDATAIFAEQEGTHRFHLRMDRITPKGHPTREGYMVWEKAMAARALTLVQQWDEAHPTGTYTPPGSTPPPVDFDAVYQGLGNDDDFEDKYFKNHDDQWLTRLEDSYEDYGNGDDNAGDDAVDENDDEAGDDDNSGDDDEGDDDSTGDDDNSDDDDEENDDDRSDEEPDDDEGDDDNAGDDDDESDDDNAGDDDEGDDNTGNDYSQDDDSA
jgi:lysophospholipase L1-like esterase